jgi:hypothetical protein
MATNTQYEIFKAVYDEEVERYSALESRSKLYLTILTFYLGAIAFKIEDVMKFVSQFRVPLWLYMSIALVLLLGLLLTILATRIREFEGICDLEKVVDSFGAKPPTDEDFLDDRLADLVVATKRNSIQNDKIATCLQWASYMLFVAVLLQLFVFLLAILNSRS